MMIKKLLGVVTLLSVALWTGCATGGSGHSKGIQITVEDGHIGAVAVTLTVQFTAAVTGSDNHAVTWSVSGDGCTGSACGTINSSGLYTAPAVAPNPVAVKVTATSQADTQFTGSASINVVQITVTVTPKPKNPLNVAKGVTQQFTATNLPDDARAQAVTWSLVCDAAPNSCGTLDPATGLYTAPNTIPNPATAHVTATSTVDPTGSDTSDIVITASRLSANSFYAFHLSGFDSGNHATALAGNFQTNSSGGIVGGTEDELTTTAHVTRTITSGSLSLDNNAHGTLTLMTSAGTHTYKVVFNGDGDGKLIEFDSAGRASGEIIIANNGKFNVSALPAGSTFAFGLTGVDTVLTRAGFVGVFKPNGAGAIGSGQLDSNENGLIGRSTNVTGAYDIQSDGRGTLSLTNNTSGKTYNYAIYVTSGVTNKAANPLTLFVISTDDPQISPAVSGSIVFQDPTPAYVNSEFTDFWVASLTGVDNSGHTLVSLTSGSGDGQATGHISGVFDANNAGTILGPAEAFSNYSYNANPINTGRYELDLLGNPKANPAVAPLHFVLYSSATGRGFLLSIDASTTTVYTGTMDQQPGADFGFAELAGSFVAATGNVGTANANHAAMNLLFASLNPNFTVAGRQDITGDANPETLTGTYVVNLDGTGTITLTQPGAQKYVIYALDNPKSSGDMIQHFVMINVDTANQNPAIIFAER